MAEFRIAVDLSHLIPPGSAIDKTAFPSLALAVQAILDRAEGTWKEFASGRPLPSGRSIGIRTGEYMRSINQRSLGDFAGEVYTTLPYADAIEHGSPARDMRELLRSSLKVRVSKTGRRYLIIPFRHDTGNAMSGGNPLPDSVRQWWEGKVASYVRSTGERPVHSDIRGALQPQHAVYRVDGSRRLLMTPSRTYHWGDRLHNADLAGLSLSASQAKRYAGMVNFRRPGATGGASHSRFITFRTMSEGGKPNSWRQKAKEGYWPARTTADIYRPLAEQIFQRAVEDDIRRLLPRP